MPESKVDLVALFITASDEDEARRVGRGLLEKRLAACVNLVPGVESHYWWQGRLEQARECLLLVKTRREQVDAAVAEVCRLHSYSVPEVIALPVVAGNADYLAWVRSEAVPERAAEAPAGAPEAG